MNKKLKELGAKHRFRDPIYGYIYLTDDELAIIDTPLFQRLRRIHQLALTKYVYPTAEHSRFVHSVGAVQSATEIFLGIYDHELTNIITDGEFLRLLTLLRFAALLHDIGHLPFSHAAEKEWLDYLTHEDLSQFIIKNYEPISSVLEVHDATNIVASILSKTFKPQHRILHEVISGHLDADRADYLLRDSYFCGVKYGEFDFTRYVQIFGAHGTKKEFALTVEERDIYMAEAFLMSRYHYNLQVPYHRTRSGYDFCLRKFLSQVSEYNDFFEVKNRQLVSIDFDFFEQLDDYRLFERFKKEAASGNIWAKCLLRKEHLKAVLDTSDHGTCSSNVNLFKSYYAELLNSDDFIEDDDFFVQNVKIDVTKIKTVTENNEHGENEKIPQSGTIWVKGLDGRSRDIRKCSWIFAQLTNDPMRVLRIFVRPDKHKKAEKILSALRERGVDHEG